LASSKLDQIVRGSLERFVRDISVGGWTGRREREAISLYVLDYLQREVSPGGPIRDVTQIAIEVPVRQIDGRVMVAMSGRSRAKAHVAKDLVIWPRPRMTCWSESDRSGGAPLAIMEWKFGTRLPSEYDVKWLEAYSKGRPGFTGYAVSLSRGARGFELVGTRVRRATRQERWLLIDGGLRPN